MNASPYLEQALFYDQTPTLAQLFKERSNKLFETARERSYVDIHIQKPCQLAAGISVEDSTSSRKNDSEWNPSLGSELFTQPPSLVDHSDFLGRDPPRYVGLPGLRGKKVSDVEELEKIGAEGFKRLVSNMVFLRFSAILDNDGFSSHLLSSFVRQSHSYSRLAINWELFESLMKSFGIFPRFREFVILFGTKRSENEIGLPQLRFRRLCLGFECAYGLRYAELNGRKERNPWSIRQTVIYHKYKFKERASTWVIISASSWTEKCLDRYIKSCPDLTNTNPFEIHIILIDNALANWRPYIIYLTEEVTKQSSKLLVASLTEEDSVQLLDVGERQVLKDFEDRIIDILLVLDSANSTISSLIDGHDHFVSANLYGKRDNCSKEADSIAVALREKQSEVVGDRAKVETLHKKVRGSIELLSSLLDLGNGHALKILAEEARKENTIMRQLTEKGTNDAIAIKVLTIITLIYLPATFVSNFFSTAFVNLEQQTGGAYKVAVSSDAWIFAAISAPLTILTLTVWWVWTTIQRRQPQALAWKTRIASLQKLLRKQLHARQYELDRHADA